MKNKNKLNINKKCIDILALKIFFSILAILFSIEMTKTKNLQIIDKKIKYSVLH